ncbi:hypothetical protein CRG98_016902 [Punica granatum]|uniref:Uncharacterized protein n=1 Tax=Punica granatum TaxID=22663 RepID=A0A2I0K2C0_PUNGR|nr:hypothetical protein CRG98_016902 [Punica granatum]
MGGADVKFIEYCWGAGCAGLTALTATSFPLLPLDDPCAISFVLNSKRVGGVSAQYWYWSMNFRERSAHVGISSAFSDMNQSRADPDRLSWNEWMTNSSWRRGQDLIRSEECHRWKGDGCGGRWWWKGDGKWVGRGRVRHWRCGSISVFRNLGWRNPRRWVELEDARFGPLSRANSSAMLVVMLAANWLTMPSSVAMRAWSSEADDVSETRKRGAPEDIGGGRCIEGAPEYTGSTPHGSRRWWSMHRGRLRMCRGRWIDFLGDIDAVFFHHPDTLTSWVSV